MGSPARRRAWSVGKADVEVAKSDGECYCVGESYQGGTAVSASTTTVLALRDEVENVVLAQLSRLRLPAADIIDALAAGEDPRIPSRKAMNIIARVQRHFGLETVVVKASDLKPRQVSSVRNLIDLLTRRLGPVLGR